MGFELLTQPQVFTTRLTAIGGIEGYVPPFVAKFHTWTINTPNAGTVFDIPQDLVGLTHAPNDAYIVNINRTVVPPTDFTIDYNFRRIIFNTIVPQNTTIRLTQIGTIALTANSYVELTATRLFAGTTKIETNTSTPALQIIQNGLGDGINVEGTVVVNTSGSAPSLTVNNGLDVGNRIFMSGDGVGYSWIGARDPGGNLDEGPRVAIGFAADNTGRIIQQTFRTNNQDRITINEEGYVGIGSGTLLPNAPLHISNSSSKILQTPVSGVSPTIQQNFTFSLIDSKTGFEIVDEANPAINIGNNSHRLSFNRIAPIKIAPYWLTSNPSPTSSFILSGGTLTNNPQNYIVTVGGLVNPFGSYEISTVTRELSFRGTVPANVKVFALQPINPDLAAGYDVTSVTQVTGIVSPSVSTVSLTGLTKPWYTQQYQYLVSFNGITQVADTGSPVYTITPETSTLNFVVPIPGTYPVTITRLPSANPNSSVFEDACFVAESFNWSFNPSSPVNSLTLTNGPSSLLTDPAGYIVNIGGVLQIPTSYRVNPLTRVITFSQIIGAGTNVSITQVAHPEFPIKYTTTFDVVDDCTGTSTGDAEEVVKIRPGEIAVKGGIATALPVTVTTSTYSVPFDVNSIIFNTATNCVVSLPKPSKYPGRWLSLRTTQARIISAFPPNIRTPINALTGVIFAASGSVGGAGRWAQMQSDGTDWVIMAQGGV